MKNKRFFDEKYAPFIEEDLSIWEPLIDGRQMKAAKGREIIARQGDTDQKMILVASGLVLMTFSDEEGNEKANFLGSTGYVFGFRSCLLGNGYNGSLTAVNKCSYYSVPAKRLKKLMGDDDSFLKAAMYSEFKRGLLYSYKTEILALSKVEDRVIAFFYSMAAKVGMSSPQGTVIPIKLTEELIGKIIFADRVSVSRAIINLKSQGFISNEGRYYVVNTEM